MATRKQKHFTENTDGRRNNAAGSSHASLSPLQSKVLSGEYFSETANGQTIAEHAATNPFGRVPVLETSSGNIIESAAVLEYLEDVHPTPSLRPGNALTLVQMRGFILATDHYLFPVIRALRSW